jgi:hypothetical protein
LNLTVKSVVDAVNDVVSRWCKGSESALVLLDQVLLFSRKSWDAVKVTDGLVWSVGGDLSGNSGVKTGHLQVCANVGVVDINNLASSEVSNTFVITDSVGGRGESGKSSSGGGGSGQEFTALGVEGSGCLCLLRGNEGGNGPVGDSQKKYVE